MLKIQLYHQINILHLKIYLKKEMYCVIIIIIIFFIITVFGQIMVGMHVLLLHNSFHHLP